MISGHIGELTLRRRRAGEELGAEGPAIEAHAASCPECRARLRALDEEQRRFEQEISFDRFAAGVERAARNPRVAPRPLAVPARVWAPVLAMAAGVALLVTLGPLENGVDRGLRARDRIKGGAGMIVRVAGNDGQRSARVDGSEPLARGEKLRLGYQPGGHRYLLSLSIDDRGTVTPIYPEQGRSLSIPESGAAGTTRFLPDSMELTGTGVERIVVLLSDTPIDVAAATRAAHAAYDRAGGDLLRLPPLGLPGEEFSRTFSKP
jgi:hypothetical protein